MGLSSRKEKQRIPVDPRNLTWADDAAKFGSNYLSKFGWDSSKGLGIDGDGRKSHIKVSHKLDLLGIGAAHQKDPSGIAWKQNRDFEVLLKRLNEERAIEEVDSVVENPGVDANNRERKNKRKRGGSHEGPERTAETKRKKAKCEDMADTIRENSNVGLSAADTPSLSPKPYIPRHRAHRARVIASKSITSKSAVAIAEILGIAPTPSVSTPPDLSTPLGDDLFIDKITTSTQSVADYFKGKFLTKPIKLSVNRPMGTPDLDALIESDTYDAPRRGLASYPHSDGLDAETRRVGVARFSSLTSLSFLASTVPTVTHSEKASQIGLSDNNIDTENLGGAGQKERKNETEKEARRRARAERKALKQKKRHQSAGETSS
ncbi:hypothetical protein BDZ94DRAFT_885770 [Collybia nuda]|uniref:PinX1-related protein 1 n=1 Tax=Collybia nuda TaxID=64659 RepID=A0A9P6CCK6_9AGAR|nr:hypothetical protein BDZ94DRAFT_885770 [Collybia nuda]